ncbi:MAG: hypothetical protein ACRD1K_04175 [Acidimicrobiales bacterium]
METRRWLNPHQPQMLQIAVFLLYANAFWAVLALSRYNVFPLLSLAVVGGSVVAGWGIANERKSAYPLAVAMAVAPFAIRAYYVGVGALFSDNPINLMFDIALVALLLHPQSRDYQRTWPK